MILFCSEPNIEYEKLKKENRGKSQKKAFLLIISNPLGPLLETFPFATVWGQRYLNNPTSGISIKLQPFVFH